jgi:predicted Rossmann-fold nucleotide-binding protein
MRMMMEYEETMQRLAANGIRATVQFFGSARALDREQFEEKHSLASAKLAQTSAGSTEEADARAALVKLEKMEWMCEYIDKTRELARRLTEWSISSKQKLSRDASTLNGVSRSKSLAKMNELVDDAPVSEVPAFKYAPHATESSSMPKGLGTGLYVCTGGAGGFMEAANRGAADVPSGRSIGMGISLPFETGLNPYVSPELAFE